MYCISLFPPYIEDYNSFNKEKLNQRNQIIKEISTIYTCEHPICETLNLSISQNNLCQ